MRSSRGDDRFAAAEADTDALLRMRIAIADATFVAEGLTLGLLLRWAERAPLSEDRAPLVLAWSAPDTGVRLPADR